MSSSSLERLARELRSATEAWSEVETGYVSQVSPIFPTGADSDQRAPFAASFRAVVADPPVRGREYTVTITESTGR